MAAALRLSTRPGTWLASSCLPGGSSRPGGKHSQSKAVQCVKSKSKGLLALPRTRRVQPRPLVYTLHTRTRSTPVLAALTTLGSDVATGPEDSVADFWDWLQSSGLVDSKAPRIRLERNSGGLCLVAQQDLGVLEEVFVVPDKLWFSQATAKASPIGRYVEGLDPWVTVALFLLYEKGDPQSKWRPYLDVLPKNLNLPLSWSDEELELLQGSQLLGSVYGYRDFINAKFAELDQELLSQHRDVFPTDKFSLEEFQWAFGVVRSRTHAPFTGEDIALVPLVDMVSHSSAAAGKDGQPTLEKKGLGFFGNQGTAATLPARQGYAKGQKIVMDYGSKKTVGELALDYGILEEGQGDSKRNRFSLTLEIPESDRFFEDKADIAETNDLAVACQFELKQGEEPSATLLAFLRLVALSGPDAFLLESIFRATVWGHMNEPVSDENEAAICQSMIDGIRGALQGYSTTIEEDVKTLAQLDAGSSDAAVQRKRLAAGVCLSEKRVLAEALDWFEQRLANINMLEYYQERRLKNLGLVDDRGSPTPWIFNG